MKKNGFHRPFHKLQVLSWIYMLFTSGVFSFLSLPLFSSQSKALLILFFSILLLLVLLLGFFCTIADPTDPAIKESIRAEILSKSIDYKKYPKICKICKHHVNQDTKHCRECERCVLHFDHHCKWLNNCIGDKNYRLYFALLIVFESYNIFIFTFSAIALYGVQNKESFGQVLENAGKVSETVRLAYVCLLVLLNIATGITITAMIQLISFHVYLGFRRKTTYEFILARRKAKNKYKISTIKIINENEAIEEVPLEEVFEPYMENPQYVDKSTKEVLTVRVAPENFEIPPVSESEESPGRPNSA